MSSVKLKAAINVLRSLDADMPMSTVITLLSLADGEPIEVRELYGRADVSMSALNRSLTYLGENHWSKSTKKAGLGLVEQRISPEDRRVRIASLTPKGRRIIQTINEVLE